MTDMDVDDLLRVERAGWESLCESRGGRFYGRLMTPDAVMILVNGMVLDRPTIERSLDDSPPWTRFELADARVIRVDDRTSALLYRATATRTDSDEPFVALMTSVYTLVDSEPRLALYQQTALQG